VSAEGAGVNGPGANDEEEEEARDDEMENEIAEGVTGDPLAQYDVDVSKEGEMIQEYLALVASTAAQRAA
jgi:hypothetical protein